jgi:hypothetical protein
MAVDWSSSLILFIKLSKFPKPNLFVVYFKRSNDYLNLISIDFVFKTTITIDYF